MQPAEINVDNMSLQQSPAQVSNAFQAYGGMYPTNAMRLVPQKTYSNFQFSVNEYCARIQQEFQLLERQYNAAKHEINQLEKQKSDLQETIQKVTQENSSQLEINSRLTKLVHEIIDALPKDQQAAAKKKLEQTKNITLPPPPNALMGAPSMHSKSLLEDDPFSELSKNDNAEVGIKKPKIGGASSGFSSTSAFTASGTSSFTPASFAPPPSQHPQQPLPLQYQQQQQQQQQQVTPTTFTTSPSSSFSPASSSSFTSVSAAAVTAAEAEPTKERLITGSPPPLYPVYVKKEKEGALSSPNSSSPPTSPSSPSTDNKKGLKRSKSGTAKSGRVSPTNSNAGIPRTARLLTTLPHNEVVCAVTLTNDASRVFTGGKGSIKIWDLSNAGRETLGFLKPVGEMQCLPYSYIRSCKLTPNGKTLLVGGESNLISVWDIEALGKAKLTLHSKAPSCHAITCQRDEDGNSSNPNIFYSCHSDGSICTWDALSGKLIRTMVGHTDLVSCCEVSPDGGKLISGGLDNTLRVWDIGTGKELGTYAFNSQIFALGVCPGESWLAVGLANSNVEVLNLVNSNCKYQLHLHESCVLSLKFANSGKWFVTTGKDRILNSWRSPFGASIFQCREPNSILCSDLSADDRILVTGSGERLASVYEVVY